MRVHIWAFIALLTLSSLLMPGCLQSGSGQGYAKQYSTGLQNITLYDPSTMEVCKLGQCVCMACRNTTSWFGFRTSFAGGNCLFIQGCTQDKFNDLINGSVTTRDKFPRQFMIGQGYSFSDFGDANGWCGNRLDMAVQWLVGTNETNYTLPDSDRAKCWLQNDIMPVYVLYSKSQNINVPITRQIADRLKSAGPVVITTEMDYNWSVPGAVDNVSRQVQEIDAACNNERTGDEKEKIHCFVALGVRLGDYEGVKQVRQKLGVDWKKVDLIAFGINAHTLDLNWTNDQSCNPDAALQQALAFARFSLYNNSKPTIIPYIMFDSSGPDSSGRCNWSEDSLVTGYGDTFKYWLFPFQKAGVIGMAAYAYNISQFGLVSDPLGCRDCSLGTSDQRMAAWFGSCRNYKIEASKYPVGDNMIVFPNESGGTCDYNMNAMGLLQAQYTDQADQITPNLTAKNATLVRCDACVNENKTFPDSTVPRDSSVLGALANPKTNDTYCRSVPALDFYASKWNIDPMLVRAIAIKESGFDPCAAAKVYPGDHCYDLGYDYVPDLPGGTCHNADNKISGARYCAIGLMQSLEPPYTFWPSSLNPDGTAGQYYSGAPSDQLFLEAQLAGRSGLIADAKAQCSPYFNPYNATHSACMGAYKFSLNFVNATAFVQNNEAKFHTSDSNTLRIITYYIALHKYFGDGGNAQSWVKGFDERYQYDQAFCDQSANENEPLCVERSTDPACYGDHDFVNFVRQCVYGKIPEDAGKPLNNDYGSRVLSIYRALVDGCGDASGCPSWRTLASAACTNAPALGTPQDSAKAGDKCVVKPPS
jgi:hypothetical protein